MLSLFCLLSVANAITWITFSPIAVESQEHFDQSSFMINLFSVVFMIAYIPIVFPAAYALDIRGVRFGLSIGAVLTTAGAWVRYAGSDNYYITFAGQTLAAIAQPFILNAAPMVGDTMVTFQILLV